jgi:ABC-type branched-subunit amino acid transport system substrate-binding protein
MRLGIEAAFRAANANGRVHGRQLRLAAADDGYEPLGLP